MDIDTKDDSVGIQVLQYIFDQEPVGPKSLAIIPTKNGYHIVTRPFRCDEFFNHFPDVDIHKDNPTILYCDTIKKEE